MACVNPLNQNQVLLPLNCNARPAIFNLKDGSISFLPELLTRNRPDMNLHSPNPQIFRNEYSLIRHPFLVACHPYGRNSRMIQGPHPLTNYFSGRDSGMIQDINPPTNHLPEKEFRMVQGAHPVTNHPPRTAPNMPQNAHSQQYQLFPSGDRKIQDFQLPSNQQLANRSKLIQHSHFLQFQLSSNGVQVTENLHPVTNKLSPNGVQVTENLHPVTNKVSPNESNIPQLHCSLAPQLPVVGIDMSKSSNVLFQHPSASTSSGSLVKYSLTHRLSQVEPNRNQVKYLLAHQQGARESAFRQGLQSIFQRHSKDGLFMAPGQKIIENQGSNPSSTFPEVGFNLNQDLPSVHQDLSISNTSLDSTLYPQYSEKIHICVVGPPGCGKADLIRSFARNENILIPTGKPLRKVFQQGMVCFRTNLIIDIWHADDLTLAAGDLRFHCESSKSVLVLVYSVAQKTPLSTVLEWIKLLKCDIVADVPLLLVENTTNVKSPFDSREFYGVQLQVE